MGKRRFIQMRDPPYDFVEVSDDYTSIRSVPVVGDRHYAGLQATDGADISTRTKHREYMRQHGLTTMDDYTQTWEKAAAERAHYFTKGPRDARADVERAIHQLENQSRRRNR